MKRMQLAGSSVRELHLARLRAELPSRLKCAMSSPSLLRRHVSMSCATQRKPPGAISRALLASIRGTLLRLLCTTRARGFWRTTTRPRAAASALSRRISTPSAASPSAAPFLHHSHASFSQSHTTRQ
eukprot:1370570-Pleurochrysis_carterae.AAC.2